MEVLSHIRSACDSELRDLPDEFVQADLVAGFGVVCDAWLAEVAPDQLYASVSEQLRIQPDTNCKDVCGKFADEMFVISILHRWLNAAGLMDCDTDEGAQRTATFNRLMAKLNFCKDMCIATCRATIVSSDDRMAAASDFDMPANRMLNMWTARGDETNFQKFVHYAYDLIEMFGYRKKDDHLYAEVVTSSGYASHAWEPVCTIERFFRENVREDNDIEMWKAMTHPVNVLRDTVEYIMKTPHRKCKEISWNRNLFSCRNGIYNIEQNAVYLFGKEDEWQAVADFAAEQMGCWGVAAEPPSQDDVATRYFDEEISSDVNFVPLDEIDIFGIETEHFDIIVNHQFDNEKMIRTLWAFLGRLFYNVDAKDKWQVFLMLIGVKGCGKSLAAKTVKNVYQDAQVGLLGSNTEARFPLMGVHDKLLILCLEVKRKFELPVADLQSLVSGEHLQVNIKHEKALTKVIDAPVMMCGNEMFDLAESGGGALNRRMVAIECCRAVVDADPLLEEKVFADMVPFIQKANVAYLQMARKYRSQSVWSNDKTTGEPILPEEIRQYSETVRRNTDPLFAFLTDTAYVIVSTNEEDLPYVPYSEFIQTWKQYVADHNLRRYEWNSDFYKHQFNSVGIKLTNGAEERMWNGERKRDKYIIGVSFPENN